MVSKLKSEINIDIGLKTINIFYKILSLSFYELGIFKF